MSEEENGNASMATTKKRKSLGRMIEITKKLKVQSHEQGEDCHCSRLQCFTNISEDNRKRLLHDFNLLNTRKEQSTYLSGLKDIMPVAQRRSRKAEYEAQLNDQSYKYKVRIPVDGHMVERNVCYKAFLSIFGISKKQLETLQKKLKAGAPQVYRRGKHTNRPKKHSELILRSIEDHIKSFKGRQSHYSLHESQKVYLPDSLSVKKMHAMFMDKNPSIPVSYETYRKIFCNKFNISLGILAQIRAVHATLMQLRIKLECHIIESLNKDCAKPKEIEAQLYRLCIQNKVHLKRAEQFHTRKRRARLTSKKYVDREAIAMDFQKNLCIPNLSTNNVYYCRQLSLFSFNIHVLSSGHSLFYTYPETVAHKAADEVCSMLLHFIFCELGKEIKHLTVFCDSDVDRTSTGLF